MPRHKSAKTMLTFPCSYRGNPVGSIVDHEYMLKGAGWQMVSTGVSDGNEGYLVHMVFK